MITPAEYRTEEWSLRAGAVKLSAAQRHAIENSAARLDAPEEFTPARATVSTFEALVARGLIESVDTTARLRLTPLGLAVRAQLRTEPLIDNRYDRP